MRTILISLTVLGLLLGSCKNTSNKQLDNVFYCQNTMWDFDNKPETPLEKAQLMKSIGFDGLEGFGYKDFFELKKELDNEGLGMPVNYVKIDFGTDGKLKGVSLKEIKEMIKSSDKGNVIYLALVCEEFNGNLEAGDKVIVPILQELAEYAATFNVKLGVYPHVSFYCETVGHSVKIAELVNKKNFGATLNLCHLLKVEGMENIEAKLKTYTPWLFAVNISGADVGDTQKMGWDRLIQPLGQGTYDTYEFVKALKENGYDGPIGIQVYNLKGDVVATLTETIEVWEDYKTRYANEK